MVTGSESVRHELQEEDHLHCQGRIKVSGTLQGETPCISLLLADFILILHLTNSYEFQMKFLFH